MAQGMGSYARLLAEPAARRFCAAALLGRMQISMTGLSTVLLVSILTGSFGRAGLVTAVGTVTGAVVSPWWGRTSDRIGQSRVLLATAGLFAVGVVLLIVSVLGRWPLPGTVAAAVVTGLGISQAGNAVRARWTARLPQPADRDVAFALEAVVDEVIFITGPLIATFACTAIHPALGLALSAALTVVGCCWLAAQRDSEPPAHPSRHGHHHQPLGWALLAPLMVCCLALGTVFGGMEVAIVAFATERRILPFTAVFTMAWAAGSLVAGLATGALSWRVSATRRFRIGSLALALSLVPMPFLAAPVAADWWMAPMLVISGLAIAPTLIASVAVVQAGVPATRLTESLGWTQTGLAAGVATGGALIGRTVDVWQAFGGFSAIVGAGVLLVLGSFFVRSRPAATAT